MLYHHLLWMGPCVLSVLGQWCVALYSNRGYVSPTLPFYISFREGFFACAYVCQYHRFIMTYAPLGSDHPVEGYKHPPISVSDSYARIRESTIMSHWTELVIPLAIFGYVEVSVARPHAYQ